MQAMSAGIDRSHEGLTVEIAANNVVSSETMGRGSRTVLLIVSLFLMGALLVASAVLGSALLLIGTFVAFSMMMLIGLPLILACVEDAIDPQSGH